MVEGRARERWREGWWRAGGMKKCMVRLRGYPCLSCVSCVPMQSSSSTSEVSCSCVFGGGHLALKGLLLIYNFLVALGEAVRDDRRAGRRPDAGAGER